MSSPKVSVVVPVYNHEQYVRDALYSVLNQTYETVELIVVDDFSADKSSMAVNKLLQSKKFRRRFNAGVRFHQCKSNVGAHAAINYGISLANGEYIAILNSDDEFDNSRLQKLVESAKTRDMAFGFTKCRFISERGNYLSLSNALAAKFACLQGDIKNYPSISFSLMATQVAISTGNFFFSRDLVEKLGGFRNFEYCHDWDFALRACLEVEPFFLSESLYKYRLHSTNSFRQLDSVATDESCRVLLHFFSQIALDEIQNNKCPSPTNWPGVFEYFICRNGFGSLWEEAVRSVPGYARPRE